jgi:hypothetical protein
VQVHVQVRSEGRFRKLLCPEKTKAASAKLLIRGL